MVKIVIIMLLANGQGSMGKNWFPLSNESSPGIISEIKSEIDSLNVRFISGWSSGNFYAVAIHGDTVFLGSGAEIYIIDVSTPSNPQEITEIGTRSVIADVYYSNGKLFIVDYQGALEVWDISQLTSPHRLSFYFVPDRAHGIYVSGSYA